jgi:hypothetical protein
MKKKPTGFIAICQCGNTIGAIDFERSSMTDTGKILGKWIIDGCTIQPLFESNWTEVIRQCDCRNKQ